MKAPLRILHLEDDPKDAALVEEVLIAAGLAPVVKVVQTEADFLASLRRRDFDLILADNALPSFDGLTAVMEAQQACPEVPFIFVSGKMGEEAAIDSLKSGAIDYVLKDRLAKLGPAVRRALREARERERRQQAEAELRESRAFLEKAQEVAHLGSWRSEVGGAERLVWSSEVYRIFGLSAFHFDGTVRSFRAQLHPEDRDRVEQARRAVIERGAPYELDHRIIRPDGAVRWVHEKAQLIRDASNRPVQMLGVVQDITERKEAEEEIQALNASLERRVEERTAQLEQANRELEAFSYSVSHDLRAPLRIIDGFSRALLEEHAGRLDAEGAEYVRTVRGAAQRMGQLIEDLLALSRVTRSPLRRARVDLSALAERVVAELVRTQPERQAEFRITPGLLVTADPNLLRIALENLLGNAWKFTSKLPRTVIEVGTTRAEGQIAFFVRDNGAGFDMAYADKLFGPFQRFHSAEEFPGTGIGLATVQRIVHRHGGRIWAQATVGQGATFKFTLPFPAEAIGPPNLRLVVDNEDEVKPTRIAESNLTTHHPVETKGL